MRYVIMSALLAAMLAAPAAAEPRNLAGFQRVQVQDNIRVEVHSGPAFVVDVSGPEADRVITRIDGDKLRISERNRPWFGPDRRVNATVVVTMPAVAGLAASRGATVNADIAAEDLALSAAMGAELHVAGACRAADVSAAMGGSVQAQGLQCATADVSAAMGGEARVFARDTFDASAAMGGDIVIFGGAHGDTSASMGGSIRIADGGKADHRSAAMGGEITQN